jgi:hypothetical protein
MRKTIENLYSNCGRIRNLKLPACLRIVFLIAFSITPQIALSGGTKAEMPAKFIFGTATENDVFTGIFERLVYIEAFRRMGVQLEIIVAPLKRIESMLARGDIDGETMRGPAYAALHPQLIMVDLPIIQVVYKVYALKPVKGLTSLDDLRTGKFRGTYRRGVVYCQNALTPLLPAHHLDAVTTVKQGVDMLAVGHTDFFCDVNLGVMNHEYSAQQKNSEKLQELFALSAPVSNSAYLHEKHTALAVTLSETLKQMGKEGLFEKYRLETIARLLKPRGQ